MRRRSRKATHLLTSSIRGLLPIRRIKDRRGPGLSPDTLIHVGDRKTEGLTLQSFDFSPGGVRELTTSSIEECRAFDSTDTPTWIRAIGLHEVDEISHLLEAYGIHSLVKSDILNTRQRPKVESFPNYLFVVLKLITVRPEEAGMTVENFSLVFINHVVITFEESPSPVFDPVVARLRSPASRIQQSGGDYLVWALLDAVVDNYFLALDRIEDEVDKLDELIASHADVIDPSVIHALKQQIFHLHRLIRPTREVAASFSRGDTGLLTEATQVYFRDLYDHVIHAIEITENLRESSSSLRDFYLASVSNRMNEVMKVLTCFATIFLPLTFIAGAYGMNFHHMPELALPWAYPALWFVFLLLAAGMFVFFRRRKWL